MLPNPILLVGGSGVVGRWAARFLREAHPDIPLLIGGRDLAKAQEVASEIGNAEGVAIDLAVDDLGLGDRPVGAVAVFFRDERLGALRFAQARRVPHISISSVAYEIAPEVAAYAHRPDAAPIVLGTEWFVGAASVPTLEFAKAFGQVDEVAIGALLDEQDGGGPTTTIDLGALKQDPGPALGRRDGAFYWRTGDDAKGEFRAVDGTPMEAFGLSANDIVGLATALDAPNVRFDLAIGESSSRRRGEPMSTEIIVELTGQDHNGRPLRTRHAIVHPDGQMPVTGFGVAMVLERLLGLDGREAVPPGLYFPYGLLDPETYLPRFDRMGGRVLKLDSD